MLSIRLARNGAKKRPFYHIVVSENERIPTGQALEVLGFVNPIAGAGEAIRIDVEIQNKIRRAEFFVGDFTAVYQYEGRLRVNENFLVEVGYALASKEPSQVLLLALKRDDVPGPDATVVNRAFDIAHVHRLEFGQEEKPAAVRDRVEVAADDQRST